jgi:hypothetical protein
MNNQNNITFSNAESLTPAQVAEDLRNTDPDEVVMHYAGAAKLTNDADVDIDDIDVESEEDMRFNDKTIELAANLVSNPDVAQQIESFDSLVYYPEEMLNYNHPWMKTDQFPDEELNNKFLPPTSKDKFRFDKQVIITTCT